jgi:hypothetical protein
VTSHASTWSGSPHGGRAAPGTIIGGRYSLRTAIGNGGMGTVWRAADTILRREVAVKEVVLPPGLAASDRDSMYERTLREARAAASLSHPSVVQVFDVVTEGGRPWIVMELLDARGLADMVIEDGPLAPRSVAKIGIALLGALEVAHAGGVLHRDVKPANVLITSDGRCVLTDFGVAKLPTDVQLTTPGMVLGSPHFISPERALGHQFGPPSDLFSLGVTLYTAVEGRPPFDKGDPLATMHAVVEDEPVPPVRCGPLIDVLYGLMEKDPSRRWDVSMARAALRELLAGPLAQNPTAQHVTDPWSVVPSQPNTTAWVSTDRPVSPGRPGAPATDRPAKPIGGRAMLHTGESPTARAGRSGRHGVGPLEEPTGVHPAPTGPLPVVRPAGSASTAAAALTALPARLAGSVRSWPRQLRIAVAAGTVAVALLASVAWAVLGSGDDPVNTGAVTPSAPAESAPNPSLKSITHRGVTLDVPVGWKVSKGSTYIDYRDPKDSDRWLRINVTDEKDATKALQSADRRFAKETCKTAYTKVGLTEAKLGGVDGAQLEFLCTPQGKEPRHAIWRIAVINGKARHVYLSTWETSFAQDKAVFDTALASFRVA